MHIAHFALVVKDYDEALSFYIAKLNFQLIEDTLLDADKGKRWVVIAPPNAPPHAATILLAKADGPQQENAIGNRTGGRVGYFLATEDLERDYASFKENGIKFVREPQKHVYGMVAVWEDLYGNLWDLIEYEKGMDPTVRDEKAGAGA